MLRSKVLTVEEIMLRRNVRTVEESLSGADCPLPLEVIPNQMGINLCAVSGISWVEQEKDGQIVQLTIHFLPSSESPTTSESSTSQTIKASDLNSLERSHVE